MIRRRPAQVEVVPEVRGKPCGSREDRQSEPGHDLVRAQGDHQECVNQGHERPGECRNTQRCRERKTAGRIDPLNGPEAGNGADQHHPFHPQVEDARALGEHLAQRREQERRPVEDCRREDENDEAVVHPGCDELARHAASALAAGAAVRPNRIR